MLQNCLILLTAALRQHCASHFAAQHVVDTTVVGGVSAAFAGSTQILAL